MVFTVAASEFEPGLQLEGTVSGFGGKDSKRIRGAHQTQVCSSGKRPKPYGDSRNRMIEDIPRIDTDSEAPGFGDLNTFFHSHVRSPRAETFNRIPSQRTAGAGQRSLQHDLTGRIADRIQCAQGLQRRRHVTGIEALRIPGLCV